MWTTALVILAIIVGGFIICVLVGIFLHTLEKNYPKFKTPEREQPSEYQEFLDETK